MIEIVDYTSELSVHFDKINRQWIKRMFVVEDLDEKMLRDPQKCIIDQGGHIWFAKHPEFGIIGTCALLNQGQGYFELTKMGVLEQARGLKAGEVLLNHVIEASCKMDLQHLFLLTNKSCEAAIHLYEKCGFVHDNDIMLRFGTSYQRCDVAMKYLKTSGA